MFRSLREKAPDDALKSGIFNVKYVRVSTNGKNKLRKNARISFSNDGHFVFINQKMEPFNARFFNDEGMSRDYCHHKLLTPDYMFWVRHEDYHRFIEVLGSLHNRLIETEPELAAEDEDQDIVDSEQIK